jgi:hypothetical protein
VTNATIHKGTALPDLLLIQPLYPKSYSGQLVDFDASFVRLAPVNLTSPLLMSWVI